MEKSNEKMMREGYLETQLRMAIWIGLNRPLAAHPIVNALYIFRAILFIVTFVALIIGCIAHMKIVNNYNLLLSSINVLQVVVYIMGILHVIYYQIRNEAVHCLISKVREAFRFASNTGHFTMDEPIRVDTRKSIGWTVLCTLAATCWFALAMAKGEDPVPVWAPVNLRESPYYEINTILQLMGQLMIGSVAGCFGSFYISVLSLFRSQFDMLSCSLKHMAPLAALRTRKKFQSRDQEVSSAINSNDCILDPRDDKIKIVPQCQCCTEEFKRTAYCVEIETIIRVYLIFWNHRFFKTFEKRRFETTLTPSEMRVYEKELYDTLTDCIVHYQNIVRLTDEVQDFFGPIILIRFILNTMMQCFTIYSSSKFTAKEDFSPQDMTFISLVEYYLAGVGEMFIFCYIPDQLLRSSMMIPSVMFESVPWYGGGVTKKFASSSKIFHLSTTKPTCLRTAFYVVSLDIMSTMIRASFSFYTLLRKLQ